MTFFLIRAVFEFKKKSPLFTFCRLNIFGFRISIYKFSVALASYFVRAFSMLFAIFIRAASYFLFEQFGKV